MSHPSLSTPCVDHKMPVVEASANSRDGDGRRRILLLHGSSVMHYRVPVYNYFHARFQEDGIDFAVAGPEVQPEMRATMVFPYRSMRMCLGAWLRVIRAERPEAVILFSGLRNLFILPLVWLLRAKGIRIIYWGHGVRLSNTNAHRRLYGFLHRSCHSIILYSENLKPYIARKHWPKVFVANNTLCLGDLPLPPSPDQRRMILRRHNIETQQNIIFVGRMQARKRIPHLLEAARMLACKEVGIVLVGPDVEGVLPERMSGGVVHIPELYGRELLRLMMACDVYCCPGWVGLNIVDAMACGLPFVTEALESHAPEIMYLKDGQNGIVVAEGRVDLLANALATLLGDHVLSRRMASCARNTYREEASVNRMYQGFSTSVKYVLSLGTCRAMGNRAVSR